MTADLATIAAAGVAVACINGGYVCACLVSARRDRRTWQPALARVEPDAKGCWLVVHGVRCGPYRDAVTALAVAARNGYRLEADK